MAESTIERELIKNLCEGDAEAFKVLYEKHAPRLKAFCHRFHFTDQESFDIIQDTFAKIWEKRATIDPGHSFGAFLITISKNMIYNRLRHAVYKKKYIHELTYLNRNSNEGERNEKDLQRLIDKTVDELPGKCRQIYQMSRIKGLTNTEIAEKLQISRSTVENQINKALKTIKQSLQSSGYTLSELFIFMSLYGMIDR